MIKSMNYKTMYVIIAINDWEIEQMNVKTIFFVRQNSRKRLRRTIHEIWARNQQDLQIKQDFIRF
jgi:hypothetical protein